MNFTLQIMGTASAMPVIERFQSAQVLNVHGRIFLIDCGEGVQRQLVRYHISIVKLDSIYISHSHGDHVFGIFGLLSTMGMMHRTTPLAIYGPANFSPVLESFLSYYGEGILFEIDFHPLSMEDKEMINETEAVEIFAFPLKHKIETYGFLFNEKKPKLNIKKYFIEKYSLNYQERVLLKDGKDIIREDGTAIKASAATYLPFIPRSYAYCSDTESFPEIAEWVRDVDLLYHETTYLHKDLAQAVLRHHSTTLQAAECAKKANAKKLVIAHYSTRCLDSNQYMEECKTIFPETYAAQDGDIFDIPISKNREKRKK